MKTRAYTSEASIKVPSVKMLFDFHELRSSLFGRIANLGSSARSPRGHIEHEVHIVRHRRISMLCIAFGIGLQFGKEYVIL